METSYFVIHKLVLNVLLTCVTFVNCSVWVNIVSIMAYFYVFFLNKSDLSVNGLRYKPAGKSMAEIAQAKHVVRLARQLDGAHFAAHMDIFAPSGGLVSCVL